MLLESSWARPVILLTAQSRLPGVRALAPSG
jgi:hypothetical protein